MFKSKLPDIKCHDCQKPMIYLTCPTLKSGTYMAMQCPDLCEGQPNLILKAIGPFWKVVHHD